MIGIYNDSSSTTFSVYTYGEIVWPGGSSSAGVGYYISALVNDSSSYLVPSTFSIGGSTYRYINYCSSVYGHNYSQFYFSNFDGVITEGAFSGFRGFVGPLVTNATRVEALAFASTNLPSVSLLSASYVGYSAFANGIIASADLPMCETVEPYAFYSCSLGGYGISLPVCKNIGAYAFTYAALNYSSSRVLELPSCETIGACAFARCYHIRHVSLPVCRTLGKGCFEFTNLSSISLPMCEYIGEEAFMGNTQLRAIKIGPAHICKSAFKGCTNLSATNLISVKYIEEDAFMNCSSISANLSSCEYVGSSAFYGCSVIISSLGNCSYIGSYAFCSATAFGSFVDYQIVPWSVPCEYIGSYAFASCSFVNLEIHLPVCSYIGDYAFASGSFTTVRIYLDGSSICELGGRHILSSIHTYMEGINFYVPSSLYDQYVSALYWSNMSNRIRSITS